MKSKNFIYFFLIAIFAVTACSKSSTPNPSSTQTKSTADTALSAVWPTDADIYFVGTASGASPNNFPVATIWKNGVAAQLPSPESGFDSEADALIVSGSDIYIIGKIHVGTGNVAGYWKNKVFTALKPGGSEALAIATGGHDIYIAGNVNEKAAYWKNGVVNIIARQDSNTVYQANAIAINGNDIYMAGISTNINNGQHKAVLWKNGVLAKLPDNNSANASAQAIAVNGTDVYAVGYTDKGATLWKNGVITILSVPSSVTSHSADAIIVNESNIYIGGYANGRATIWKNGIATILPFDESGSTGQIALVMDHNDVYVASGVDNAANFIYWKNGVAYQFTKIVSEVHGMTVVSH